MMNKKAIFCAILSLFLSQNASAFCDTLNVRVDISTNPGNVQYITTKSKDEFIRGSKQVVSPNTLGLTVSNLTVSAKARAKIEELGNQYCASLGALHFNMGYESGDLKVYIDKKYKPGSCEYEVIRQHEDYHVKVAQQAVLFFKPDIEKKIHEVVGKLRPQVVRSKKEADAVVQSQSNQISAELMPLIDHINKTIAAKNAAIDTPESYAKTTAMCKNW